MNLGELAKLKAQQRIRVQKLLEEGLSRTVICERVGVSKTTIYKWLKKGLIHEPPRPD